MSVSPLPHVIAAVGLTSMLPYSAAKVLRSSFRDTVVKWAETETEATTCDAEIQKDPTKVCIVDRRCKDQCQKLNNALVDLSTMDVGKCDDESILERLQTYATMTGLTDMDPVMIQLHKYDVFKATNPKRLKQSLNALKTHGVRELGPVGIRVLRRAVDEDNPEMVKLLLDHVEGTKMGDDKLAIIDSYMTHLRLTEGEQETQTPSFEVTRWLESIGEKVGDESSGAKRVTEMLVEGAAEAKTATQMQGTNVAAEGTRDDQPLSKKAHTVPVPVPNQGQNCTNAKDENKYMHVCNVLASESTVDPGFYAAILAAKKWNFHILDLLLQHHKKQFGVCGFHQKAVRDALISHERLKDRGIHSGDENKKALTLAAVKGHAEVVQLLLEHHKELGEESGIHPGAGNDIALTSAAEVGRAKVVQLLLEHHKELGEKSGIRPGAGNNKALTSAAEKGRAKVVQLLLEHHKELGEKSGIHPGAGNNKALTSAAEFGRAKVVQLLLEHHKELKEKSGIRPGAGNNKALTSAAVKGHAEVVQLLLEHHKELGEDSGIHPGAQNNIAFRVAAECGRAEVVKLLLEYHKELLHLGKSGIIIDPGAKGDYALKVAALYGHADVVKLLLKHHKELGEDSGIHPGVENNYAFRVADERGHSEVVRLLAEYRFERGAGSGIDMGAAASLQQFRHVVEAWYRSKIHSSFS